MTKQIKDNTGVLFRNHKKKTEKQPDYTGQCRIDGFDKWQSAWLRKAESGETYMFFQYRSKEKESVQQKIDNDEDIPF